MHTVARYCESSRAKSMSELNQYLVPRVPPSSPALGLTFPVIARTFTCGSIQTNKPRPAGRKKRYKQKRTNHVQTQHMQVLCVIGYKGCLAVTVNLGSVSVGAERLCVWFGLLWGLRAFEMHSVWEFSYFYLLKLSVFTSSMWVCLSLPPWAVDTTTLAS